MSFPKIADVRSLSDEEIAEEILATKRKLFNLRLQKATRQLETPHEFKHNRHRLAQLMTVEGERKRAAAATEAETSEAPETPETTETTETPVAEE